MSAGIHRTGPEVISWSHSLGETKAAGLLGLQLVHVGLDRQGGGGARSCSQGHANGYLEKDELPTGGKRA